MALSNWDTMAFNSEGEPSAAEVDWQGLGVAIHKNWLSIRSRDLWHEGCPYQKPTIAKLWEGRLEIERLIIHARRGSQDAIFVVLAKWNNEIGPVDYSFFGGIGCYGYENSKWEGVLPETVAQFFTWAESLDMFGKYGEWLAACKKSGAIRYNQGDKYFADKLGTELPATKPGEGEEPVVAKMLKSK